MQEITTNHYIFIIYLVAAIIFIAVIIAIVKDVREKSKNRWQEPFEIKKGDVLVDKRFDDRFNMVEIYQVSEDGERCLYRKHIIKGAVQDCTKLHESDIEYFQYNYKKAE